MCTFLGDTLYVPCSFSQDFNLNFPQRSRVKCNLLIERMPFIQKKPCSHLKSQRQNTCLVYEGMKLNSHQNWYFICTPLIPFSKEIEPWVKCEFFYLGYFLRYWMSHFVWVHRYVLFTDFQFENLHTCYIYVIFWNDKRHLSYLCLS